MATLYNMKIYTQHFVIEIEIIRKKTLMIVSFPLYVPRYDYTELMVWYVTYMNVLRFLLRHHAQHITREIKRK